MSIDVMQSELQTAYFILGNSSQKETLNPDVRLLLWRNTEDSEDRSLLFPQLILMDEERYKPIFLSAIVPFNISQLR